MIASEENMLIAVLLEKDPLPLSFLMPLPLIGWSENDEHLALIGLPQPDDLALQVEVLGPIVSEHHNQGLGRSILQSNKKSLTTQKMRKIFGVPTYQRY